LLGHAFGQLPDHMARRVGRRFLPDAHPQQDLDLGDIVQLRVFLVGAEETGGKLDFAGLQAGYTQFFGTPEQPNKPARTALQVVALPLPGALVEVEAIAARTN
jgi:enamine deaminase RidA (YjgF/YER057c/UK114 family)